MSCQPTLSVLGTGDFGQAFGCRLMKYGVHFSFGSRDPLSTSRGPRKHVLDCVAVKDVEDCCLDSDVIVLAMYPECYDKLRYYERHLVGKVLVDVSNTAEETSQSNAEMLAAMLPRCHVVKAFNTIASDVMAQADEGRNVHVCGNDDMAKNIVLQLATRIGFNAIDCGGLKNSSELESKIRKLFPGWGWPCVVVLVVASFWTIFTMCRHFKLRKDPYSLERLPTNMANKIVGSIGATCLSLTFIPGCLAAFIQLANGTKHVEFPRFLNEWLKMRQKLGLFALFFVCLHLVMSEALMSPAYLKHWYIQTKYRLYVNNTYVDVPVTTRMNWMGETVILMGVLALAIMIIMAITTIPSIARSLSWREWRFVHSHLGFLSVVLTASHLTVKGAPLWMNKSAKDIIPTITFLSCVLPWVTIVMRLVLYMPCVYRRISYIRNGQYQHKVDGKQDASVSINTSLPDRELSIIV